MIKKLPVSLVVNPDYFANKENLVYKKFEIKGCFSLDGNHSGSLNGIKIRNFDQFNDISGVVVMAIPFGPAFCDTVKRLLAMGVKRKNIVLLIDKPDYSFEERINAGMNMFDFKIVILDSGEIACIVDDKRLLVSTYNELFIVSEIFYLKSYDFDTPYKSLTVIDIGMNIGMASIFFAYKEGVNAVYSFEPFPETFDRAIENFMANDIPENTIYPHSFGVGKETTEVDANYDINAKGLMSLHYTHKAATNVKRTTVQIVDIAEVFNAIIERHPDDKFIFKIDCEGGEYDIFERLDETQLIKRVHIILMEWHNIKGKNVLQLEEILARNNFDYQVEIFRKDKEKHDIGLTGSIRAVNKRG